MTISEEIAAPGFLSDIHASGYLVAKLTPAPDELGLAAHGLELITPDPNWAQVYPDGRALAIGRDLGTTVESFAQFSAKDGETWRSLYRTYLAAKPAITASMNSAPPSLAGIRGPGGDRRLSHPVPERPLLGRGEFRVR
jgi:phytoene dehydrogenase-like protein